MQGGNIVKNLILQVIKLNGNRPVYKKNIIEFSEV